jgi:hypothetical protein
MIGREFRGPPSTIVLSGLPGYDSAFLTDGITFSILHGYYKNQATCGTRISYYRCFLPDLTGFITSSLRRAWLILYLYGGERGI